jgi:hypothetical protein
MTTPPTGELDDQQHKRFCSGVLVSLSALEARDA